MSANEAKARIYIARGANGVRRPTLEAEVAIDPKGKIRLLNRDSLMWRNCEFELEFLSDLSMSQLPYYNGMRMRPLVIADSAAVAELHFRQSVSEEIQELVAQIEKIRAYVESRPPDVVRDELDLPVVNDVEALQVDY